MEIESRHSNYMTTP